MTPERWRRIEKIYTAALVWEGPEREAFLQTVCGKDQSLRREVESLLAREGEAEQFLEAEAMDLAARDLAQESPFRIGQQVGFYRILALLGRGGMGDVYLAEDERLGRKVALKVLPESLRMDPSARRRFVREARSAAALDHPFICKVYEAGEVGDLAFIAIEYVAGQTLSAQLSHGPLPLKVALERAVEIAEALDAAHRQHIVHRDLKPSNILLAADGHLKVADFGLAKRLPYESSQQEGSPSEPSRTGMTMGTLAYMSPEQLRGEVVDTRSDLFSFGLVLYEMLTGTHPFRKPQGIETGHAILSEEPRPLSDHLDSVPPLLQYIIGRMLAKDPKDRWQTAYDLSGQLKWLLESGPGHAVETSSADSGGPRRWSWIVVASLACAALAAGLVGLFSENGEVPDSARFSLSLAPGLELSLGSFPVISPDGRHIVFSAAQRNQPSRLWIRSVDAFTTQPLEGTEGAYYPFWSPDSRQIGFFSSGKLKKMSLQGGTAQTLCSTPAGRGGSWSASGILYAPDVASPIFSVSAAGGSPKQITQLEESRGEIAHRWPFFLPDGRHFLFLVVATDQAWQGIRIGSLDSPETKFLMISSLNAVYAEPDLLFTQEDRLMGQRFDAEQFQLEGEPFLIAEGVDANWHTYVKRALFSASLSGHLAYRSGTLSRPHQLVWFDRQGRRLGTVGKVAEYYNPDLSPDETRLAVALMDPQLNSRDIWILDLIQGTSSRFTFDPSDETNPVWSREGGRIAFTSDRRGVRDLYYKLASGTGAPELVLATGEAKNVEDWSPDGKFLAFNSPFGENQLWTTPLSGEGQPFRLVSQSFRGEQARFSPDGRWVVYSSAESGRPEIYVQPFPPGPGKWQISHEGGRQPQWRADGKEIFYLEWNRLMAVSVEPGRTAFRPGRPQALFEIVNPGRDFRTSYEVASNGRRFLFVTSAEPEESAESSPFRIVLNWRNGLER